MHALAFMNNRIMV